MKNKWAKTAIVSLIFLSWTGVIILKYTSEISLKVPLFISSIISLVSLIILFKNKINFNLNKDEKLISKLTENKIEEKIIKEAHEKRWNNLRPQNPFPKKISDTINNNLIYAYWVKLNLDNGSFIAIINASHPELEPSIYPEYEEDGTPISEEKVWKLMNKKSINPNKEANREISEETIDQFGKPIRRTERIINPENKEEESEDV
jgi:hypothetical protein